MSDLKHSRVTVILTSSVTGFLLLLQALYNEYIHFKETEIPAKEAEKGHIEHLYKLLQVRASGTAEEHEGHRVPSRWCITGLRQRDGGFCVSAALCESGHKLRAASPSLLERRHFQSSAVIHAGDCFVEHQTHDSRLQVLLYSHSADCAGLLVCGVAYDRD